MEIAIIGMGPAGVSAVKTLRSHDFQGRITMFSTEKVPPYSPPVLGKYLLTGNRDALFPEGRDFCKKYSVNCRSGEKIIQIMPERKELETEKNEIIKFDYLIIASGSSLYAPVKGSDKKNILNFKSLAGAEAIRKIAEQGDKKTAIIAGGGFIGVEIALCLAKTGIKPLLIEGEKHVMPDLIDSETAFYVENSLKSNGVDLMAGIRVKKFIGEKDLAMGVLTETNEKLTADIYIAATGVKPNIEFLKNTDIECNRGIIVNDNLSTRYPYIYACGDVAETIDLISKKRKLHGLFPIAKDHGITAACNIMGIKREYKQLINMNSLKELGFKLIVAGEHKGEEIRYKKADNLRKIYIKDNKINGFVLINDISYAGFYLSLLIKQTDISAYRDRLLSDCFYTGFITSQFH